MTWRGMRVGYWVWGVLLVGGLVEGAVLVPLKSGGEPARRGPVELSEVHCTLTSEGLELSLRQENNSDPTQVELLLPDFVSASIDSKLSLHLDPTGAAEFRYVDTFRSESGLVLNTSFDDADITSTCDATISRGIAAGNIKLELKCQNLKRRDGKGGLSHFAVRPFETACTGL